MDNGDDMVNVLTKDHTRFASVILWGAGAGASLILSTHFQTETLPAIDEGFAICKRSGMEHPLRTFRKTQGISFGVMAALIDVSKSFLSQVENGQRNLSPHAAYRVSEITGIPVHDLRPDIFRQPEQR